MQAYSFLIVPTLLVLATAQPTFSDNCLAFNGNTGTCLLCSPGFFLQGFFCVVCAPLCSCSSRKQSCDSCITLPHRTNYSIGSYQLNDRCYLCSEAINNCMSCMNPSHCTKCYKGHYLMNITEGSNVLATVCSLSQCLVNSLNTTFCDVCKNALACQLCLPGFYLDPTTEQCVTPQCQSNCTLCSSPNTCEKCALKFYMQQGICLACLPNCLLCIVHAQCEHCVAGFAYNKSSNTCYNTTIANCVEYSSSQSVCNVCEQGYYVLGGTCNPCVGCSLCAIQFICWSTCMPGAVPFNYACLSEQFLTFWVLLAMSILLTLP